MGYTNKISTSRERKRPLSYLVFLCSFFRGLGYSDLFFLLFLPFNYSFFFVFSAVSLSPHHSGARFVATASTDRTTKLWDRQDLAVPISWSKRSRVTDIRWRRHWPGVLVSVEDAWA